MSFEYGLQKGNNYFKLGTSTKDIFKTTREVITGILEGIIQNDLNLNSGLDFCSELKLDIPFLLEPSLILLWLAAAHSQIVKVSKSGEIIPLESDVFPTKFYFKKDGSKKVELGDFFYSKVSDADDSFAFFAALIDEAFKQVTDRSLKESVLLSANQGFQLICIENDRESILFELHHEDATGTAYGRETTLKMLGYNFIAAA